MHLTNAFKSGIGIISKEWRTVVGGGEGGALVQAQLTKKL